MVVWAPVESVVVKLTIPYVVVCTVLPLAESVVVAVGSGSSVLNHFLSLNIVVAHPES